MSTPKHSLLAKTIIWYLNSTNSQATSMQVSLKSGTLYNLPNPHQSNDWCNVTRESMIFYGLRHILKKQNREIYHLEMVQQQNLVANQHRGQRMVSLMGHEIHLKT